MRHLQKSKLEMEPLLLPISQLSMRAQHDLQMPRQIFFGEQLRDASHALPLIAGDLQQGRVASRNFGHDSIPQEPHHLSREMRGILPPTDQPVHKRQNFMARTLCDLSHHFFQ
jgi:hypothetical protein